MFNAIEDSLPIKTADTFCNRVQTDFLDKRSNLRQDLAANCHIIALLRNVWTSEHQLSILGVISHWITPDFEKQEELLEFTEIHRVHSGENMTEVPLTMLKELQIIHTVLIITGDNTGNNKILCDSIHTELLKPYDDKDNQFRIKPLM
jgi:hypothetical protein